MVDREPSAEVQMHLRVVALAGATHSFSLKRTASVGAVSPTEVMLADLEDAAVAAVLKFKRQFELRGPRKR